ncbi:hypothetical protein ACPCTO_03165 [Streptomyces olivoreticuli]
MHTIAAQCEPLSRGDFLAVTTLSAYASETPTLWCEFASRRHGMCAECASDLLLMGLVVGAHIADVHYDAHEEAA